MKRALVILVVTMLLGVHGLFVPEKDAKRLEGRPILNFFTNLLRTGTIPSSNSTVPNGNGGSANETKPAETTGQNATSTPNNTRIQFDQPNLDYYQQPLQPYQSHIDKENLFFVGSSIGENGPINFSQSGELGGNFLNNRNYSIISFVFNNLERPKFKNPLKGVVGDGTESKFPPFLEFMLKRIQQYYSVYKYQDQSRPASLQNPLLVKVPEKYGMQNIDNIVVENEEEFEPITDATDAIQLGDAENEDTPTTETDNSINSLYSIANQLVEV